MKRYRAIIEAYDGGTAECVITEFSAVAEDRVLHKFLVQVNTPEARDALFSALHDAIHSMGDDDEDRVVREGYNIKLWSEGSEAHCYIKRTELDESGKIVRCGCEFDKFVVKGNHGGVRDAMDVAHCAARGRLTCMTNPG